MANPEQVRKYLAYWFQLGKKVVIHPGPALLPQPVICGNRYSDAFETTWQHILARPEQAWLDGTDQTIAQLLGENWEMGDCARCAMPVPIHAQGLPATSCPCQDLCDWPNTQLPQPRSPVDSHSHLKTLQQRLSKL